EETKIIQNACYDDESGKDENSDNGSGDESEKESESNLELEENVDTFSYLKVWDAIGKNLEDLTAEDMRKLEFNRHSNYIQFYKMYAKVKGFGIRHKHPNYNKLDGHITPQLIWCNREGFRVVRNLEKKDRKPGGLHKVGFLASDLYNTCERFKEEDIKDGDTETAFGTVIAFHTTYKVNAYKKPLVVIVGVNNHRKTVPFAVALVTNETEAQEMYEKKKKWSEAYMHGQFFAGCSRNFDEEDQDDYISTHTFSVIHGILRKIKTKSAQTYTSTMYEVLCKELAYESWHIVTRSEEDLNHVDGLTGCMIVSIKTQPTLFFTISLRKLCVVVVQSWNQLVSLVDMFAVMKYDRMVEIPRGMQTRELLLDVLRSLVASAISFTEWLPHLDNDETKGAKGKKKAKEGVRLGKKKKFGPGFNFVNLLKYFIPKTYNSCAASNAKDCYEVNVFAKDKTVFDWDPKKHF
ncbi:Protein FAR1-RELATED SEQUENCE 5, partial [Bienertia sinuspersici]